MPAFRDYQSMIYADPNTCTISIDLFNEVGTAPIERLVVDFIRREVRQDPAPA